MIRNFIGKGTVKLTQKELDDLPAMVPHELSNTDMYKPVLQFKFMDMYGMWNIIDVIYVKNEDEIERGVNFFCYRVELMK